MGPKRIIVLGLGGYLLSGVCYLLSLWTESLPVVALTLLCAGRVILGLGQSFVGTGATLWGVGTVGSSHIGRVISWNGVASYGALAIGALLGVWLHHLGGLGLLSAVIILIAGVAIGFALPRPTVKTLAGKKIPFSAVVGKIWRYELVLGFASCGFGVIATFITLFYASRGWDGAAFDLTLFSAAFVGTRLLFPNSINRYGGLLASLVCYTVEIIGLGLAGAVAVHRPTRRAANRGRFLLGFPGAVRRGHEQVPAQNQGSALATFTAFMDLALGIVGPLAGMLMARAGAASIYLAAALLVFAGRLMNPVPAPASAA